MKKLILIILIISLTIGTTFANCKIDVSKKEYGIGNLKSTILNIGEKIANKSDKIKLEKIIGVLKNINGENNIQKNIINLLKDYFNCEINKNGSTVINNTDIEGCSINNDPYHLIFPNIIYELLKISKGIIPGSIEEQKEKTLKRLKEGGENKDGIEKIFFSDNTILYRLDNYLTYYKKNTNKCSFKKKEEYVGDEPISVNPLLGDIQYDRKECDSTNCKLYKTKKYMII